MRVLHIDSSPKGDKSNSRALSQFFIQALQARHHDIEINYLDLTENPLPHVDEIFASAIYKSESERTEEMKQHLALSDTLCQQLLDANAVVFGIPMHNWCYPSVFKAYIDHVTRGGLTYHFDEKGNIVGALDQHKFLFITTRGADLSEGSPYAAMDALTPALKAAFKFIGAEHMKFIDAQPLQFSDAAAHNASIERTKHSLQTLSEKWL